MPHALHAGLAILAACVAGAVWGGIAGWLKATTGAHEVISTIMLSWIAIWVGVWLFGLGGPLQSEQQRSIPVSVRRAGERHLGAQPRPSVFEPQLATNLTYIIQGPVVLFVSAPVIVTSLWGLACAIPATWSP